MEHMMAVKELERGREFANQLLGLIFQHEYVYDDKVKAQTTSSAEDLVAKILYTFTNTLSLFNHNHHSNVSSDSSISSSSFSHHFPSNSDESHHVEIPKTRMRPTSSTIKDPTRSSPKKRKGTVQTWVEDSKMTPKEDGHAWRKYGQN